LTISEYKSLVVDNKVSVVGRLCQQLLTEARENNFTEEEIFAIHLALVEALVNAVKHGNRLDPHKKVKVKYSITPGKFDISITDDGNGFNPVTVPDPRENENLYKLCGRGMLLMRSYMDVVEYNEKGNSVHMLKYKAGTKEMPNKK